MRLVAIAILFCLLPWCAMASESGPDDSRPMAEIDAMIAAAEPGATLRIPAGTYVGNLLIDKPITLDGGGAAIFDGQGRGNEGHNRFLHGSNSLGFVSWINWVAPEVGGADIEILPDRPASSKIALRTAEVSVSISDNLSGIAASLPRA